MGGRAFDPAGKYFNFGINSLSTSFAVLLSETSPLCTMHFLEYCILASIRKILCVIASLSFSMGTQVNYAVLDVLAAILLYNFIMVNADPIHFRTPPEDSDLAPGTSVRLYTKNSFSFVAEGNVVETLSAGRRASRMLSPRATRRVKVSLTAVLVPGAITPYPDERGQRPPLSGLAIGAQVTWDTVRMHSDGRLFCLLLASQWLLLFC